MCIKIDLSFYLLETLLFEKCISFIKNRFHDISIHFCEIYGQLQS